MKPTKLTIPDVMHVDKKGNVVRKPLVVGFEPIYRDFVVNLPNEIANEYDSGVLSDKNLGTLISKFEDLMDAYQRKLLLTGAEEVIWIRVATFGREVGTASVFLQVVPALVRRDPVTKLITHATGILNGSPGKAIDLATERPIFLAKTEENQAKARRLLDSIDTAHKVIDSISDRGQLEWQPAFDSIIEMHSTIAPANAQPEQPKAEPVQQSLPLADDEEL
jgi:hypothetical protein